MDDLHDLELLLRSDSPICFIETREEPRLLDQLVAVGRRRQMAVFRWSVTEGLARADADLSPMVNTQAPEGALRHIKATPLAGIYVLLDFHPFLGDPKIVRYLKEIAQDYRENPRTVVLISHAVELPEDLRHLATRFEMALPDAMWLKGLIREEIHLWQMRHPGQLLKADPGAVLRLAHNLGGVTASDARRLVRNAIEDDGAISASDVPAVMKAKYALLSRDGLVSFEYDTADFAAVAGLDGLKRWLRHRRPALSEGQEGLDPPKGVLLLGVQGAGKSLAAKAVAGEFGLPLLRLDFAVLYDKYIGETERNLREALAIADTMAPCVLWIDEIEKGVASADNDQGVSRRVLGTLLNWMAERRSRVFVVATANDISALPPELVRKGRFDEIFFVDLPDAGVRKEIFRIHLAKRSQAPEAFGLDELAQASAGFAGAEIEQAVVAALYAARAREEAVTTDLVLNELAATRPLSVVMAERVDWLRRWAADRAVPAH
jgi:SpoVK/Ycf46/Vps4 family AAA+-type ATPase